MLIKKIGWLLLRIALLNGIGILLVTIVCLIYTLIESGTFNFSNFSTPLLIITLFLSNTVYLVGNSLESLHSKLWNLDKKFFEREKPFFKAGIVIAVIVNATATVLYLIS